jgi:hypothetical protein
MAKCYSSQEVQTIFNVVRDLTKNNEHMQNSCKRGYLNEDTKVILNELKKYITDRTDDALLVQMSLVAVVLYAPTAKWAKNSGARKYFELQYKESLKAREN